MTTIRATCPTCGEVGLTPQEMELRVDPSGDRQASYNFDCPSCLAVVTKPADERIVRLLASGGVPVREVAPARRVPEGPVLSYDDLLDFHRLLQTDWWFDELLDVLRLQRDRR
jgi:hypothetical protein